MREGRRNEERRKAKTSIQSRESHAREFLHILFILCDYIGYQNAALGDETKANARSKLLASSALARGVRTETV